MKDGSCEKRTRNKDRQSAYKERLDERLRRNSRFSSHGGRLPDSDTRGQDIGPHRAQAAERKRHQSKCHMHANIVAVLASTEQLPGHPSP